MEEPPHCSKMPPNALPGNFKELDIFGTSSLYCIFRKKLYILPTPPPPPPLSVIRHVFAPVDGCILAFKHSGLPSQRSNGYNIIKVIGEKASGGGGGVGYLLVSTITVLYLPSKTDDYIGYVTSPG